MKSGLQRSERFLIEGIRLFGELLSKDMVKSFNVEEVNLENSPDGHEALYTEENINPDDWLEIPMSLDIHSMQELVGDMSINFSGAIEALREKIESFIMTSPFSQSGLNGYEGSSACAVIAIATGCVFSRETVRRPLKEMAKAFVGCIEFGNGVYQ